METNKTSDDGKTPITLENLYEVFSSLHEVFSSGPSDEWEKGVGRLLNEEVQNS